MKNSTKRKVQCVIFDMDGVIIDSEPLYVRLNNQIYRELGVTITDHEYRSFIGIASVKKWSYIKEKSKLDNPVEELMDLSKSRKYEALSNGSVNLMSGILDLLDQLKQMDIKLALASSNSRKIIQLILDRKDIGSYFQTIVSGDEIRNGKPSPDIFLKAADNLAVVPQSCLVIEDSNNGVQAAKSAGMLCIGFDGPAPHPQDFSQADLVISDYSQQSIRMVLSRID